MELKNDIDFIDLYARRLKEDNSLFSQQKVLIESQMKSSRSFFRNFFRGDFKKNARDYLKKRGLNIITLDLDIALKPDCVGSVLHIPFSEETFLTVAGFELLEHIPYEDFRNALKELKQTTQCNVLISLPDVTRIVKFSSFFPRIGEKKIS